MNVVSFLGLLAILALAWALSTDRRAVRPRVILWGVGLQALLAAVLLGDRLWSLLGIAGLAGLLVVYMARSVAGASEGSCLAALLIAAALSFGLSRLESSSLALVLAVLGLSVAANARVRLAPRAQPWLGVLILATAVAWVIAGDVSMPELFTVASYKVASFLSLSDYGARFLFGDLANERASLGFLFAFKLLPVIVFFGGFMAVLYYLGIVQRVIEAVARFMRWTMGTGGAETLCAATNIFIGQTEAPLLIKPYLARMTRSELHSIMVGGFATVAGGAIAGYIAIGVPAAHLLAASVLSAPASLVIAKTMVPEAAGARPDEATLETIDAGDNLIEAASNGITDGLKLAVNVGAMLIGFIALIAVVDLVLNQIDLLVDGRLGGGEPFTRPARGISPVVREFRGLFPGSLQTLFGTMLRPVAWLMGVSWSEAGRVGHLLGMKISLNEFVAYGALGGYIGEEALSERSVILSTYALCGFANFGSVGIQIGGLAAIAPARRTDLAQLGLRAMLGGALASWMTACIAGVLIP
ncbi:MAG: NupC/NupG family nucleoside CNT transporter [Acidobacteriota bacterium]|nr:NupC/NupG family nucleoside CNT transporter [Acidobacteriota bacterium]